MTPDTLDTVTVRRSDAAAMLGVTDDRLRGWAARGLLTGDARPGTGRASVLTVRDIADCAVVAALVDMGLPVDAVIAAVRRSGVWRSVVDGAQTMRFAPRGPAGTLQAIHDPGPDFAHVTVPLSVIAGPVARFVRAALKRGYVDGLAAEDWTMRLQARNEAVGKAVRDHAEREAARAD